MAVLIQDMELPESCAKCRFCNFIWLAGGDLCFAFANVIEDRNNGRPDWCLLKPVSNDADDTLIRELRRYAASYRSGENLGREIEDTDVLLEEAANRLAQSDGRLMELPCKVGDTLWEIDGEAMTVLQITIDDDVGVYCKSADDGKNPLAANRRFEFPASRIGESVFLSLPEAKAALEAKKGCAP